MPTSRIALGAALGVALGVGYAVFRRYQPAVARIQLGLERALDSLEKGQARASSQLSDRAGLMGLLADELRRALKP